MAFNNNSLPNLSRFSIGEIVDLAGVPDFYNAGSSKWLRSGVATASSNLTTTTKTNLANAGTAAAPTVLAQSSLSSSYLDYGFYASYPISRISASSISVVPGSNYTTNVIVGVMTSAGMLAVSPGQTSIRTSNNSGANSVVASNNTKIFSYCFSTASTLSVKSTTNGTTWSTETVSGLPTIVTDSGTGAHASVSQNNVNTAAFTTGWRRNKSLASEFAVFWCGARFLILAPGTGVTNYVASLSSDGFTFGGDNTTAVIGSTTVAVGEAIQFYRNGNNCYLQISTTQKRYSTDGGITWAASTFAASPNPNNYIMQYNTTDPAKLIIKTGESSTTAYYSADSGATWSANRPLPNTNTNGGLYYKGSTVITSSLSNTISVSTDNGVTWATPTFPVGVLGSALAVYADANRFYAGVSSQPQILTSSDGITWTIVTLSQNFQLGIVTTEIGNGIITYPGDSNTVVLLGYNSSTGFNQCIFSFDGGVTWTGSQFTVGNIGDYWGVGGAFATPDAGGIAFAYGMNGITTGQNTNVLKSDITGGGAFYRTGVSTISPLRTNARSYVRVA